MVIPSRIGFEQHKSKFSKRVLDSGTSEMQSQAGAYIARRKNAWPWALNISHLWSWSFLLLNHIYFHTFLGLKFLTPILNGPFPSEFLMVSASKHTTRYQVASNHERLEVRCERVEQKTRRGPSLKSMDRSWGIFALPRDHGGPLPCKSPEIGPQKLAKVESF